MKTTLIIPTMNGRDDVEKVLYGINRLYKHREKLMGGCDIDKVSFVLNGPDDGTGEILKFYENRPEYYNPERLDSRKGKGYAIMEGLKKATGKAVVMMDLGGIDPMDIPRLMKPILEGRADISMARQRIYLDKESFFTNVPSQAFSFMVKKMYGIEFSPQIGFKAGLTRIVRETYKGRGYEEGLMFLLEAMKANARITYETNIIIHGNGKRPFSTLKLGAGLFCQLYRIKLQNYGLELPFPGVVEGKVFYFELIEKIKLDSQSI